MSKSSRIVFSIIAIISAYSPFFGYSYLKGYLQGAGFRNTQISISVHEAIFQTASAFTKPLLRTFESDLIWQLLKSSIPLLIIFSIAGFFIAIAPLFAKKNSNETKINLQDRLLSWMQDSTITWKRIIALSTMVPAIGICMQYIFLLLFIALLTLAWLTAYIGFLMGHSEGNKLISGDICTQKEWQPEETFRLSCDFLPLENGKELIGLRIHSGNAITYFITNDGAYEIKNQKVIQYTTIQRKEVPTKQGNSL